MLTDAWQIPPGSLLLSVVYPLAQIHCASLLPLSLPSVWFCFLQLYMDPWHGQANAASCRTLREAAPFLSFMPFLLWFSLLSFFSWKTFPQITCTWNLILGSATGEYDWISFTLQIFRKKIPNMKKEAHLLHGNNTTDKSKQIGKTHLGHVTKHSFPWYIRALESGKSLSLVRLFVTPWTSPWNSPGQNTGVSE